MQQMQMTDLRCQYADLVDVLIDEGEVVSPRGVVTHEIRDFVLTFEDARMCTFPAGIGRGVSHKVLAAEMMQWIAGVSDLAQLKSVAAAFSRFTDDGNTLYGAYGPRTFRGMGRAIDLLSADPFSRQATVPIWRATEVVSTADLPCTVSWSFLIRRNKLHMSTYMRSNDVWTGVAYDVPIMARIATGVAWALGVEVGSYTHHAQSMHIYHSDVEKRDSLFDEPGAVIEPPFFDQLPLECDDASIRWEALRNWAYAAMFSAPGMPDEVRYYGEQLVDTERGRFFCSKCRYFVENASLCRCR